MSVVLDLAVPDDLPAARVEREEVRVDGGHVDALAVQRDAAVGRVELHQVLGQLALVAPEKLTGARVEREHVVLRRAEEHRAVVHERR